MTFVRDEAHLQIVRGRSAQIRLAVYDGAETPHAWEDGERVIFAVKRNPDDDGRALEKSITPTSDGLVTIELLPTDTKELQLGTYWYEISLEAGDDILPLIECSMLDLMPDI